MSDSPPLADKASRLFTFLAKAQQLRGTQIRDFTQYSRDGEVQWFADLPSHEAVRWGADDLLGDVPLLSIDRLPADEAPEVPAELDRWLDGTHSDPSVQPTLRTTIGHSGEEEFLDDHPRVRAAYERWIPDWTAWSTKMTRDEPVRHAYAGLFKIYVQATQKTEEMELLLGVGLLSWSPTLSKRARRHVFTVPVTPRLDDATGRLEFHLDEAAIGLNAELDMLDPDDIPDQKLVHATEQHAHAFDGDPLDPSEVAPLAQAVVARLHARGSWDDRKDVPEPTTDPVVAWAPALVLRPRPKWGLVQAFFDIAHQIQESGEVPDGLLPLIDPDRLPPVTENRADGALLTVDNEVISPLPLNRVQRQILERVDTHAQTLVQGPPGTGKTHTAAALLSHLLAQGQRVLVTAHTDRALYEVRNKLPDQIRPLAVSVIGASRDDLADLRTAVDTIARRAGEHDPEQSSKKIEQEFARVDMARRERQLLSRALIDARETDVSERQHRGYTGTIASIAQQYHEEATQFAWLSDHVSFEPDSTAPVTDATALEWLGHLRDHSLSEYAEEAGRRRPAMDRLPDGQTFAELVRAECECRRAVDAYADLEEKPTDALRALSVAQRDHLKRQLAQIADRSIALGRAPAEWVQDARADVLARAGAVWRGRVADLRSGIDRVDELLNRMPAGVRVELDGDMDQLRQLARTLKEHLDSGATLKTAADGTVKVGLFASSVVKECRPVLERARVNGIPPSTSEALAVIIDYREAWTLLDQLDQVWPANVTVSDEDTPRERVEWHRSQLSQLHRVIELADVITYEDQALRQAGIRPPNWSDPQAIRQLRRAADAATADEALCQAREPLTKLEELLLSTTRWEDAASAARQLHAAVVERDHEGYASAYRELTHLDEVGSRTHRRDELTARIARVAPDLADVVVSSSHDEAWPARLEHLEDAYHWGATGAWVLAQDQVDSNTIQAKIAVIDQQLRDSAERIAALRAWDHAVGPERLTPGRRADLRNYSQQVTRLGKGTGKYAAQQRASIRRAMDRCRPAVPVWIMPIYRVAEQLEMAENMFDVVVVDEASQAGLEATFLQYLAPKIVVIGDDKQVSPAAVGIDQQQLRDLASQYLYDDRYKDTWLDPQRSLFDEAQMRYGGQLTLDEHRRCVPEIIGFSNRIAYEPNGIRLQPVRQFGADRLTPFAIHHIADGYEEGGSGGKINRAEARALVDDLKACLEDPGFDGKTMAVISLIGDRQAKFIEGLLLTEVPADEWSRRDLRVGSAPDFQGSERDVVFLSMVSAPEHGQRLGSLTRSTYVQRFNVAVSRAKDQIRLFHSITLQELTNTEDLRHQLLDYAYGVAKRGRELAPGESPVVPEDVHVAPFDSLFEQRVHNRIADRGFTVLPQVEALEYRIDLVVVGARGRLAVECDGDEWHGREAFERDLARQRELERCGWTFFRVRESAFYVDQAAALAPLWDLLEELDIRPSDWVDTDEGGASNDADLGEATDGLTMGDETHGSVQASLTSLPEAPSVGDLLQQDPSPDGVGQVEEPACDGLDLDEISLAEPGVAGQLVPRPYQSYQGPTVLVSEATNQEILDGLLAIVAVEGPIRGNRLRTAYVHSSGGRRVGKSIARRLNTVITSATRRGLLVGEDLLGSAGVTFRTYRLPDQPTAVLRDLGPRVLDEVPPAELLEALARVADAHPEAGHEELMRLTLRIFGRVSLTQSARETLGPIHQRMLATQEESARELEVGGLV